MSSVAGLNNKPEFLSGFSDTLHIWPLDSPDCLNMHVLPE